MILNSIREKNELLPITNKEYIDDLDYIAGIVKQNKKLIKENVKLQQENKQLKEDKKKAIEYIKTNKDERSYYEPDGTFTGYRIFIDGYYELLSILGDKENE